MTAHLSDQDEAGEEGRSGSGVDPPDALSHVDGKEVAAGELCPMLATSNQTRSPNASPLTGIEDDRGCLRLAQDGPQPERSDEDTSDEEEDAVVSDEKPLMAIYSADSIPQLLTGGGLTTNPGPILTHGRKAPAARSSPPMMARTLPSVRRAVATRVSDIAAILWRTSRPRNDLPGRVGPSRRPAPVSASVPPEKPLVPSGSGGFSLSPRWSTVLRWRCAQRSSNMIRSQRDRRWGERREEVPILC